MFVQFFKKFLLWKIAIIVSEKNLTTVYICISVLDGGQPRKSFSEKIITVKNSSLNLEKKSRQNKKYYLDQLVVSKAYLIMTM
jgi:hypothetical protein